jgi:hypothetical protein
MRHKYRVGQTVKLQASRLAGRTASRIYEVVRLLPEADGVLGYRIKGTAEPNERAVREHEITPATVA